MPVHNGLPFLDDSIGSILGQSLDDFELVILDYASTDGTGAALREWQRKDGRVRVVASARPLGLAGSSNRVVAEARAPLIARMDADDIAHRDRLQRQWEVFQAHADASLVGTLWEGIDERGRRVRPRDRWRLVRRSSFAPFPHGSTMFRRRAFDEIGGYRQACEFWEDLDFFLRLSTTGRVFVLPDVLYAYRFHGNSSRLTSEADAERVEDAIGLMYRCMADRRAGRDYGPRLAERRVPSGRLLPSSSRSVPRVCGPARPRPCSVRSGGAAPSAGTSRPRPRSPGPCWAPSARARCDSAYASSPACAIWSPRAG